MDGYELFEHIQSIAFDLGFAAMCPDPSSDPISINAYSVREAVDLNFTAGSQILSLGFSIEYMIPLGSGDTVVQAYREAMRYALGDIRFRRIPKESLPSELASEMEALTHAVRVIHKKLLLAERGLNERNAETRDGHHPGSRL